jgi:molybdopterin synthase sulfur carrier subunit
MQITLKLYATLAEYLPEDAKKHRILLDISEKETAYNVIERYNVPRERAHLVLLNGVYLTPEQREQPTFKEGDTLAVWPPVAGG